MRPRPPRVRLLPERHGRGHERSQRHGPGHLDVDDASRCRSTRRADRASEVQPRRHATSSGAGARRLVDDGERRQRGAGRVPQGARRGARAHGGRRPDECDAPHRAARRGSADVKPGDAAQRFSMHAFGAVFVEVAVDPDLGETRVRRIVGAYGAGRIVNPKLARSQCIGGMIGGIGMALMEHSVVDPRNGRVRNANLAEYAVPVHADTPPVMDVVFVARARPACESVGREGPRRDRDGGHRAGNHQRHLPRHGQTHPRVAGDAGEVALEVLQHTHKDLLCR